ncbi:MAG: putative signal transducing protein [Egibacteraceae bacterium]
MTAYRQLTALPSAPAQILKGALETEGIAVVLQRESLGSIYGLDGGAWATRVLVDADCIDRARTLLDEFETADL